MQTIKKVLLLLILINSYCILYSQTSVVVPDTVAPRGVSTFIDVRGTIDFDNTGEITLYFSFNAYLFDIRSVKADPAWGIRGLSQDGFRVEFNPYGMSRLIIRSNDYMRVNNGRLFLAEIEGLAYKDTTGYLTPDSIVFEGTKLANTSFQPGLITVPGLPVYDEFGEGLGLCYPNPFFSTVKIPFFIENEQKVKLVVYSSTGDKLPINEINTEEQKLFLKETNGTVSAVDDINSVLKPGYYEYVFTPEWWKMSNGAYYVFLIVGDQVYNKGLIFEKP